MKHSQRLTQADESKLIDFEIYQVRKKLFKLNKELKFHRITGVEVTHSELAMAPVRLHWDVLGRFGDWLRKRKKA